MEKDEFYKAARTDLTGPLHGVRVLEVATTWAGPMCGAVLADLGAEVIKVEIPSGDVGRAIFPILPGTETGFAQATVNRNKRGIVLDLGQEKGREICRELAKSADVFLENFKVGTMQRYGLGYGDISAIKPDIVYVSVTGWGQYGPRFRDAGYDPLAQATSGFLTINGTPDGPPTKAGTFLADDLGGLHAALGAIAALRHRDQTGEGQHVDVALLDAMLFQANGLLTLGAMGIEPGRNGNEFGFAVPANVYDCADHPVYVGVLLDSHWQIIANDILDQPDLATNPAFATREARAENRDLCNMLLGDWLAVRPREEAMEIMAGKGLPIARVQTFVEAAQDEQVIARDMLQNVSFGSGGEAPITGPAVKFSRTPTRVRSPSPELGEHTDDVLTELGLTDAERSDLYERGIAIGWQAS